MDATGVAERPHLAVTDLEHAERRWERLGEDREFARLALVSALVDEFANGGGAVLELGCGAGALARGVCNGSRRLYLGVDISSEVIRAARETAPPCAGFWVWDLEKGLPDDVKARAPFAAIVFSDVLYALEDPLRVVRTCEDLLRADGVFVYSMWDPRRNKMLLRRLVAYGQVLFDVELRSGSGKPWRVMVQNPRARDTSPTTSRPTNHRLLRWLFGPRRCCG